jgi:hypothetical protein
MIHEVSVPERRLDANAIIMRGVMHTADQPYASVKARPYAAVIGDIVGSRGHPDRRGLQERLQGALHAANARCPAVLPLAPSVGDEFQGLYRELPAALEATLFVRLALVGAVDVRFGVGWGGLELFDPAIAPLGQDGPAWWAAREAVQRVTDGERQREAPRGRRTGFALDRSQPSVSQTGADVEGLVNAFLLCRDEIVGGMDARDARLAFGLFDGRTQADLAAQEGVSQPAISQRYRRSGAHALRAAHAALHVAAREATAT